MTFLSTIRRTLFSPSPSTPHLLFLHGFTRSGAAFSAQTSSLQSQLKQAIPNIRFSFPNAPLRLNSHDEEYGSYAWWRKDDDTGKYVGLEESLRFLAAFAEWQGPFDGVVGFSQGGCLAGILAGGALEALETGEGVVVPRKNGEQEEEKGVKFVVAYSGFRATRGVYDAFYEDGARSPLLSVVGREDDVVPVKRSMELVSALGGEVHEHAGAHVVPKDEESLRRVVAFVKEHLGEASGAGAAVEEGVRAASSVGDGR